MEDDEELTPEPDENGILVLSNRAWVHLDPIIWSYNMKLVRLDVSYNHLTELPVQIGEMVMLRELIASFNKIVLLPPEIGKLRRLKRLVLNNNRIKVLPAEVGNMEMLEDLLLNENLIEDLPTTIAKMTNLRVLKLTSNRLRSLPFEIANILSLEELDCGNNPHLATVPAKWRGDTESLLFTCRLHRGSVRTSLLPVSVAISHKTVPAQQITTSRWQSSISPMETSPSMHKWWKKIISFLRRKSLTCRHESTNSIETCLKRLPRRWKQLQNELQNKSFLQRLRKRIGMPTNVLYVSH